MENGIHLRDELIKVKITKQTKNKTDYSFKCLTNLRVWARFLKLEELLFSNNCLKCEIARRTGAMFWVLWANIGKSEASAKRESTTRGRGGKNDACVRANVQTVLPQTRPQ